MKIKLESGSLDFLKGESVINVEYIYDNMMVGKKMTEADYINKKVTEYNQKESGKGDKWKQAWINDRAARYQPQFEELINKQLTDRKVPLKVEVSANTKYTLILKTTMTEPGFNVAVARRPAKINATAVFVESQNRDKTVAVVSILESPGRDFMGFDFDVGYRVQESYAKAGKELANVIWEQAFKKKRK